MNLAALHPFPSLQTERLVLRAFSVTDAQHLFEIRSSSLAMQYMDALSFKDLSEAEKFTKEKIADRTNKTGISWAITLKDGDHFLGDICFWKIMAKDHRAEIGYSLKPQHWNNGYMSEALEVVLNWGFDKLGLHSITADINPANKASRRLLQKMGFHYEGYFREDYYFDGRFMDSEKYGLLKPSFDSRNKASQRSSAKDHDYMKRCIELGKIAGENKEPPVGSILVCNDEIIGEGIEDVKASQDATGHAELLAIRNAIARGHHDLLDQATLYTTHEPCIMCAYALRAHKVSKIIYGLAVPHIGSATSRFQVLSADSVPYWESTPEVIAGVLAEECRELDERYRK